MPRVTTDDDLSIYYEAEGDGDAVLFAHGAGGNTASWWQQWPHFVAGHRVIALDHRGFGRSACTPEQFLPGRFERDALAVLDAEGVERAFLVCQSMGGWTGSRLAALHPDRVRALVLANTPGALYSEDLVAQMRGLPAADSRAIVHPAISEAFSERSPEGAYLYRAIAAFNTAPMPIGNLISRDAFLTDAEIERLRDVPTLVIASDLDGIFPAHVLEATAEHLGAEYTLVPGAGHSTYFEKPSEFNLIVAHFLSKNAV